MPKKPETTVTTISDVIGRRVREIRRHRDQSVGELAQAAAAAGHPELTRDAIYAIESGRRLDGRRRRRVSVDEWFAFAAVFQVPPNALLPPQDGSSLDADTAPRELLATLERATETVRNLLSL